MAEHEQGVSDPSQDGHTNKENKEAHIQGNGAQSQRRNIAPQKLERRVR